MVTLPVRQTGSGGAAGKAPPDRCGPSPLRSPKFPKFPQNSRGGRGNPQRPPPPLCTGLDSALGSTLPHVKDAEAAPPGGAGRGAVRGVERAGAAVPVGPPRLRPGPGPCPARVPAAPGAAAAAGAGRRERAAAAARAAPADPAAAAPQNPKKPQKPLQKPPQKTPKPHEEDEDDSSPVIPVLVLACDRSSVRRCLDKLLRYRPSARRFPLIVSQDCGHAETAAVIASYGAAVAHIRQPELADVPVPPEHRKFQGYYKISRHYRWALGQVFRTFRYRAAIVVEDDLEVAPDFFEYFQAVLPLLEQDRSLWCASAWNDNGKEGLVDPSKAELLYRTDFFPGLGWLLLAELWDELEPKWPPAFWDDWMRQPEQRRGRACVRPEVSRTMTFGRKGVSHGQFYDQYLKFIKLNDRFVPFTQLDLSYLKKELYEPSFLRQVYSAPETHLEELQKDSGRDSGPVRLQYRGRDSFKALAKALGLMDDLKSGVPRAGYRGVVSLVCRGRRVFLAPPSDWTGYDPSWS